MISRAPIACRPRSAGTSVLGLLACVVAALALGASPASAAECPNEQLRKESRTSPVTGQPYSTGLPDCRAYEMVSPLYKQGHDAENIPQAGFPVAPDGESVGFKSEGAFSDSENFGAAGFSPINAYISHRGESGWFTSSTLVPAYTRIIFPAKNGGLSSDFSPDLRSVQMRCGAALSNFETPPTGIKCAERKLGGSWMLTKLFATPSNTTPGGLLNYVGASSDFSRVFVQPEHPLLLEDNIENKPAGIYEIEGLGTGREPELRLVSVDNEGKELSLAGPGGLNTGPAYGDRHPGGTITFPEDSTLAGNGTAYQAVSDNGEKVFFTASPAGTTAQTLYARVAGVSEGKLVSPHTVVVSAQAESGCTSTCKESKAPSVGEAGAALYQGASKDGSKVFFTTSQQLLNEDTNTATDLYEYEFTPSGGNLILISRGLIQPEEEVDGVVRTSSDGSHVYFVTSGVLTTAENKNTIRNENGAVEHEEAKTTGENLYGYDTVTKELRFVANGGFSNLMGSEKESTDTNRRAQTTPDGRYLVFSSSAHLAGDTNCPLSAAAACAGAFTGTKIPQAVYRFDFQTGELTWVSRAAPSLRLELEKEGKGPNPNEEQEALIAPVPGTNDGGEASINDWNRAISNGGSYIVFNTAERLQANDVNRAIDVYAWHCKVATGAGDGECARPTEAAVGLISDGHDPQGVGENEAGIAGSESPGLSAMSASGSDIFFFTHTELVGQDTDVLNDLYDARIDGGFPAPPAVPSCSGEACQGPPSALPSFGSPASLSFPAGGNLPPPPAVPVPPMKPAPKTKPLTRAQLLAKALKACKRKPKKQRAACESQARKRYASKPKAKKRGRTGK